MVLLAGAPSASTAQQWEARVLAWSRHLVLVVLGSGTVWLLLRTASFENRPEAAFEPWTVWHAVVDTQPGRVWLVRHSLLLLLGVFLAMRADVADRWNWVCARGEALLLTTVSLVLMSASSHAAAILPGTARPWRSTPRTCSPPVYGSARSCPSGCYWGWRVPTTVSTPAPMLSVLRAVSLVQR